MSDGARMLQVLRDHRPVLLACEAIGWLHMLGKAHQGFLAGQASDTDSNGRSWKDLEWARGITPPLDERLAWVFRDAPIPVDVRDLIEKHRGKDSKVAVALLQAAHGSVSGIEKNTPGNYQKQFKAHLWLTSPFGHPLRNLLVDPPCLLTTGEWDEFLRRVLDLLDGMRPGPGVDDAQEIEHFARWRDSAIGPDGWLRQSLLSTIAETRVPSSDVTLWDQSYTAAALFKAAMAGALLAGASEDQNIKQATRWRVLTVGLGAEHYEARAIRVGDWTGARQEIHAFCDDVCRYVEVELPLGACVYRDERLLAFTFPGLRNDAICKDSNAQAPSDRDPEVTDPKGSLTWEQAEELMTAIREQVDKLATQRGFETPPHIGLSRSTRSFIEMARRIRGSREAMEISVHRSWTIAADNRNKGQHVCPVCLTRRSKGGNRKETSCLICQERRTGRLERWQKSGGDTIWITEVADANDRVALVSLRLELEGWLDGTGIDSLRAHDLAEWRRFNPKLSGNKDNPIDPARAWSSFRDHVLGFVRNPQKKGGNLSDQVIEKFNEGFRYEGSLESFFAKVVEDRAGAPTWKELDDEGRALWLAHQLLRKNASPGRVHRFWRGAQAFFEALVVEVRGALRERWPETTLRRRRLLLRAVAVNGTLRDRETYAGHLPGRPDAPFEVVSLEKLGGLVTICNLDRLFESEDQARTTLTGQTLALEDDDGERLDLTVSTVDPAPHPLATYDPLIVLEENPERFRVLLPLDSADAFVERALLRWRAEMGRVWDRLALHVSVVAFPRKTPYQAVIEATRNLEGRIEESALEEWRVQAVEHRDGKTALSLLRKDGAPDLVVVPTQLPDGRDDTYYPNVAVSDQEPRELHDFVAPRKKGRPVVYRWAAELALGDGILLRPALFARIFVDSTGRRFEPARLWYLSDWKTARDVWALARAHAPSITAIRNVEAAIADARERWTGVDGKVDEDAWLAFVRATLVNYWDLPASALEALVDAARRGLLEESLFWHLHVLKLSLEEGT